MFSQDDKEYLVQLLEGQTATLLQSVDETKQELRKEIRALSTKIDDRVADVLVETKQKIAEHITTRHS